MKDKLKQFVEQERNDFEVYEVDVDLAWNSIETALNEKHEKTMHFPWKDILKVAAVLLLVSVFAFGYYMNNQRIAMDKEGIALHKLSSELADTEAFYTSQIDEKIDLIKVEAGDLDTEVMAQLELLDQEYLSLKNDLRDNADSEEVINAMIEYYRLKLALLEKILNEIQKNDDVQDYETIQAI